MSWNYRVLLQPGGELEICEVYYTRNGKPRAWTSTTKVLGATKTALREELTRMRKALAKPVLRVLPSGRLKEET